MGPWGCTESSVISRLLNAVARAIEYHKQGKGGMRQILLR